MYYTPAAVEENGFHSSVTCTVAHDRQWSWEQPTCISEIMLISCENVMAIHLAWKQPWIISLSNDLFSHQTQCLLSPGRFIATIRDRWGKHKQFSWSEVTRVNIAPATSWQDRYLHTEITSKGQALFSHINLTNWKNKLGSFRQVFKLPSLYLNNIPSSHCYWSWCNKIDDAL